MTNQRGFWLFLQIGLSAFYVLVAVMLATGTPVTHTLVLATIAILAAHVLELPMSFKALRELNPSKARVALFTLLFGVTWWLPARRGLFAVR